MSLMMLAALGSRKLVTETFTANTTWPAPAAVYVLATASGYGARGTNASSTTVTQYSRTTTLYKHKRAGGFDTESLGTSTGLPGAKPADYCDAQQSTPNDPTYDYFQQCYAFTDTSYTTNTPIKTGASATGFGKTFPGSTGNVAQTPVSFSDIPVTPGSSYSIVVPSGGSITITYLK
ncbi:MAG: hypothetical protein K0S54_1138 [Alphaproteobacteria bacterium]|jgi:hypothetical protein|nr:hypothetical protein [Alphaproteobacteria bacterium]